jgi:hypothetical protein
MSRANSISGLPASLTNPFATPVLQSPAPTEDGRRSHSHFPAGVSCEHSQFTVVDRRKVAAHADYMLMLQRCLHDSGNSRPRASRTESKSLLPAHIHIVRLPNGHADTKSLGCGNIILVQNGKRYSSGVPFLSVSQLAAPSVTSCTGLSLTSR